MTVRNCFACAMAEDRGDVFLCKWTPKAILREVPLYPMFRVKVSRQAVAKLHVPNRDCPAYRAPKGQDAAAAVRPASEIPPPPPGGKRKKGGR